MHGGYHETGDMDSVGCEVVILHRYSMMYCIAAREIEQHVLGAALAALRGLM